MQKQAEIKIKIKNNKPHSEISSLPKTEILGVGITNTTKENTLEFIIASLQKKTKPYYIVTPNPEILVAAHKNTAFKKVLNNAKIALNDGVGTHLGAWFLGKLLKERFTGVQLVEKLCEKCNDWPITVGFLGAGPKVAEKAAKCLKATSPNLHISFIGQEWNDEGFDLAKKYHVSSSKYYGQEKEKIHNTKYIIQNTDINSVDVLFVAFGAPKQEFWIAEHVGKIPVNIMVGVGGALDQIANPLLRPPQWMQSSGLGWLYRLIRQPWRWKRQLALGAFIWFLLKEKFS